MDFAFDWLSSSCGRGAAKLFARPSTILATAREFDQTLVRLGDWPPRNDALNVRWYLGWNAENLASGTGAYTLSHPGGYWLAYTRSSVLRVNPRPVFVRDYGLVYHAIEVHQNDGLTEGGSSGSALLKEGSEGRIIGVLSHGPGGPAFDAVCRGQAPARAGYGSFQRFYPRIREWFRSGRNPVDPAEYEDVVRFFPAAGSALHGFIRISSVSSVSGTVWISAIDDAGNRREAGSLALAPYASLHLTSFHLEGGGKGLPGVGAPWPPGGHWRLALRSNVPFGVHGYARTKDGFAASVTQAAEFVEDESTGRHLHLVPFVNPASNDRQRSFLRISNHATRGVNVQIDAYDDLGRGRVAWFYVGSGRTRQISAVELEWQLGDGTGKWKMAVTAPPNVPAHGPQPSRDANGPHHERLAMRIRSGELLTSQPGLRRRRSSEEWAKRRAGYSPQGFAAQLAGERGGGLKVEGPLVERAADDRARDAGIGRPAEGPDVVEIADPLPKRTPGR